MNGAADPELLSFSIQVLERHGGLVEQRADHLFSLLPGPLAQSLDLPEEARLGGEGFPLLYGSPVLDKLIHLATREVPIVYGQVEVPYLKKEGFEKLLDQNLRFQDGQVRLVNRAEARTTYLLLIAHYVALSDERKEGLVRMGVHEASGALIPELEESLKNFPVQYFEPGILLPISRCAWRKPYPPPCREPASGPRGSWPTFSAACSGACGGTCATPGNTTRP
jgi:hypothetical protein